jgi:hypothetical protein
MSPGMVGGAGYTDDSSGALEFFDVMIVFSL